MAISRQAASDHKTVSGHEAGRLPHQLERRGRDRNRFLTMKKIIFSGYVYANLRRLMPPVSSAA
jgi:hypothetical protein